MKPEATDVTKLELSPMKRTSTMKKLKKARSRMENLNINEKTVAGQELYIQSKTKRDIDERHREPYNPTAAHLKVSLDTRAVTKRQLHGQRKLKEMQNLSEKYKDLKLTIGRKDLPTFHLPRNQRANSDIYKDYETQPVPATQRVDVKRPQSIVD